MSLSELSMSMSTSGSDEEDSRKRRYRERINPLEYYDDVEFKKRYRMSKAVIIKLVNMIEPKIKPFTLRNNSMSAMEQVLLTVGFYATGAYQITVADHLQVHHSTASRLIKKVSAAIAKLRPQFIYMPSTPEDRTRTATEFCNISSFPNVIGAVDCMHINIHCPGGPQAELFKNKKGNYSLNVQIISDANLNIMDVICRWPGSAPDSMILNDSHLRADFERGVYGSYYLLGDNAYPCRTYLLTPFLQPSTPSEVAYNQAHINTRNTVELCFGFLKQRFPCLATGFRVKLSTTMDIVVACCVLHNLALRNNDFLEDIPEFSNTDPPEDSSETITSSVDENTSVRSSLLLIHFNRS